MKKAIIGLLVLVGIGFAVTAATKDNTTVDALPSSDDLEGNTIIAPNKASAVIINGQRFQFVSYNAFVNYSGKNPTAATTHDVSDAEFNSYPPGGYIDENGNVA